MRVLEFYFQAGKYLGNEPARSATTSARNYTHVARDLPARGVNVVLQQVVAGRRRRPAAASLSCNPDSARPDAHAARRPATRGRAMRVVRAQINDQLPFMYGDAEVAPELFDYVVDDPGQSYTLFAPPKTRGRAHADYMIGLYASSLIKDGGTLQVGIGALGDAIVYALLLRHARQRDLPRRCCARSACASASAT